MIWCLVDARYEGPRLDKGGNGVWEGRYGGEETRLTGRKERDRSIGGKEGDIVGSDCLCVYVCVCVCVCVCIKYNACLRSLLNYGQILYYGQLSWSRVIHLYTLH